MNTLNFKFKKLGSLQFGGNIRNQSSNKLAYLLQFYYRSNQVGSLESIGIESNWIQNNLIKGLQYSFNVEKQFTPTTHLYVETEFYHYGYGLTPFEYVQKSITFSLNKKFNPFYTYANTDVLFNENNESSLYFFTGISYRF